MILRTLLATLLIGGNILIFSGDVIAESVKNNEEFPTFKGPYLGQTPPGEVAEPFAPDAISKSGWELEGVFAPGMKEFYYTIDPRQYKSTKEKEARSLIIGYRQQDDVWRKFVELPRRGEVVFSPDGQRMHTAKGYRVRVGNAWSKTKSLGPMFDRKEYGIMRLAASSQGTYVFDDYKTDELRISKFVNGNRQEPKKLGAQFNTGKWTAHPFIAPDESYLIWDSEREGGYGATDLYISFKEKDGSWGSAINMGANINSEKSDFFASVTPDGKYILFNRTISEEPRNIDIYWVDAKIIDTLRRHR